MIIMCQIFTCFFLVTIWFQCFNSKYENVLQYSNSFNNKRNFGTPTPGHYCNVSNQYLTMAVNSSQPSVYCVIIIFYFYFLITSTTTSTFFWGGAGVWGRTQLILWRGWGRDCHHTKILRVPSIAITTTTSVYGGGGWLWGLRWLGLQWGQGTVTTEFTANRRGFVVGGWTWLGIRWGWGRNHRLPQILWAPM